MFERLSQNETVFFYAIISYFCCTKKNNEVYTFHNNFLRFHW